MSNLDCGIDTETKLAEALREAEPALWLMAASGNQDAARIHKTVLDALAAHDSARAQPASDEEWLRHPQTVKAHEQWCAVAKALGADPDDPDAVLKAAQPASVAEKAR